MRLEEQHKKANDPKQLPSEVHGCSRELWAMASQSKRFVWVYSSFTFLPLLVHQVSPHGCCLGVIEMQARSCKL